MTTAEPLPEEPFALAAQEYRRSAEISPCGHYRYLLRRTWEAKAKPLLFVMLNPSTADAEIDDRTVGRCVGFAKREGHGAIEIVNLYAWRSRHPSELARATLDPVGPDNDAAIILARDRAEAIIVAWGSGFSTFGLTTARRDRVLSLLYPKPLRCLGHTKDGEPRHPLYIRANEPLIAYDARCGRDIGETGWCCPMYTGHLGEHSPNDDPSRVVTLRDLWNCLCGWRGLYGELCLNGDVPFCPKCGSGEDLGTD